MAPIEPIWWYDTDGNGIDFYLNNPLLIGNQSNVLMHKPNSHLDQAQPHKIIATGHSLATEQENDAIFPG